MADQFHPSLSELSPNSGFLDNDRYPGTVDDSETIRSDIYRGSEPSSPVDVLPHSNPPSIVSTTSSSWGRLGGFAHVVSAVEKALSRWGGSSGSSRSSSSSSSSTPRFQLKFRRNKRYPGSVYSLQSDLDFAARLSLIKARAASRQTGRHFILYIPPSANLPFKFSSSDSLQNILQELEALLRKTSRARKMKGKEDTATTSQQPSSDVNGQRLPHHHFMLPMSELVPPSRAASFTDLSGLHSLNKGKGRSQEPSVLTSSSQRKEGTPAWFLDVASPTWDDMRAIGRLLHLHPLTLEDILQKEPREKLEIFPKLGYSFISFRAMKARAGNPLGGILNTHDDDQEPILAETNIYLIIFNEGVCLFHFTDISEHIERVRNRMISFAQSSTMTSAWIAHSILDSIVDSFFPYLEAVEREVVAIEELVFEGERDAPIPCKTSDSHKLLEIPTELEKKQSFHEWEEKATIREEIILKPRFQLPRPPSTTIQKRIKRFFRTYSKSTQRDKPSTVNTTSVNLKRIATTRKLVTSLGRVLTSKADVMAQIQKRVLSGLAGTAEDVEVAIYMGDVQDHILTLQHSLAHYERMLSHSYPVYQSTLRAQLNQAKGGTDKAIMVLTVVSIGVLCGQTVIGLFSMNVNVPANVKEEGRPFNVFGIVLALVMVALSIFTTLVRWWWRKAKRRRGLALSR